jgi:hypothetical protein
MTTETTNVAYCKRLDKLNKIQMDILSFCAHHFSKSGRFLSSEVLEKMEEQKVATAIAEDNGLKKMSKQIIGQALGAAAKKLPTVIQTRSCTPLCAGTVLLGSGTPVSISGRTRRSCRRRPARPCLRRGVSRR